MLTGDEGPGRPPEWNGENLAPEVAAELITMDNATLGRMAGRLVEKIAGGEYGIPGLQALNFIAGEAAKRCLQHRGRE
jgi:hypothetical protein